MLPLFLRITLVFFVLLIALTAIAPVVGAAETTFPLIAYSKFLRQPGTSDVFLLDIGHDLVFNLSHHPAEDYSAVWSPDGRQIAFVSERNGPAELYTVRLDGGQSRFTYDNMSASHPVWSPLTQQLLFTQPTDDFRYRPMLLDVDSGVVRPLRYLQGLYGTAAWSPDETRLALTSIDIDDLRTADIYLLDPASGDTRNLTHNIGENYAIAWSPDSQQMAFVSDRDGDTDVYLLRLADDHLTPLTENDDPDYAPVWLPDNQHLLYITEHNLNRDVILLDTTSGVIRNLTQNPASDYPAGWIPSLNAILFLSSRDGSSDLYLADMDGQNVRRLTRHAPEEWVGGFSIQP